MNHTHLLHAFALLAMTGCGEPISNEAFEEDLLFLSVLPSNDAQELTVDDDDGAARVLSPSTEIAVLSQVTHDVADETNALLKELLIAVDSVQSLPPSARTQDTRTWGPFDHSSGAEIILEVTRLGPGVFDWAFSWSSDGQSTWTVFTEGRHYAGESVSDGDGALRFDYAAIDDAFDVALSGAIEVEYDLRDGKELFVTLDQVETGARFLDTRYWFYRNGQMGDFEYRTDADIAGDEGTEEVAVRVRWITGEGGRGDGSATGGALGAEEGVLIQCWAPSGLLTYQESSHAAFPSSGAVSSCPYEDIVDLEHL